MTSREPTFWYSSLAVFFAPEPEALTTFLTETSPSESSISTSPSLSTGSEASGEASSTLSTATSFFVVGFFLGGALGLVGALALGVFYEREETWFSLFSFTD